MSLKKQAFQGVFWTLGDTFILSGLSFIASLVLARILGPIEFGLIGMIVVFIAIGVTLVDSGMTASLIRTTNTNDEDYSTVFYLNLAISFLVYILVYITAPLIAAFYEQEILINILRIYSVSFIITAFSAVQLALLHKKMQFKKIMILNIPGTIIGIVIGIGLAYLNYGVWSIVWMYLTIQITKTLMLWLNTEWKPQIQFSKEKAKIHFNFGYKLMVSGLIDTIFNNVYNVVIGKFFPIQTLGYFERARTFNEYPIMALTSVVGKVTYPLMSNIQNEKKRIGTIYRNILLFTFFISAPLMLGAAAIAEPLFLLILGKEWLPAVIFFQILCLAGMLYPIHAFNINILKVFGRSDLFLKLEIIKKILITLSIIISFQFGVLGIVWSSVFVSFAALFINMYYSSSMINYKTYDQFIDMSSTFLISGATFFLMYSLINGELIEGLLTKILLSVIIGMIFYFLTNFLLKTLAFNLLVKLIKERN